MFGTRGAFRTARRAAMQLGHNQNLSNSNVRGGHFMQNCFMSSTISATASSSITSALANGSSSLAQSTEAVELPELCELPEVLATALPYATFLSKAVTSHCTVTCMSEERAVPL